MNGKELLADITGAPESAQWGIVAAGEIRDRLGGDEGDEVRFTLFSRIVVNKDGEWYRVTVEQIIDNGTGL